MDTLICILTKPSLLLALSHPHTYMHKSGLTKLKMVTHMQVQ